MFSLVVFSVFDSKVGAFLTPFFCRNRAVALRSFMSACQDSSSDFCRYSGDFSLFEIGEWFPDSGELHMFEAKLNLGLASQFIDQTAAKQVADMAGAYAVPKEKQDGEGDSAKRG